MRPSMLPKRPVDILLVEDDEGDAFLTENALRSGPVPFALHVVPTGEEALDFVYRRGDHQGAPRPDLILLDLHLPGVNGKEVLHELKEHATFRRIPIVVLTSSRAESDILRSYNLHANAYMVKPGDPTIFERVANTLQEYWFESATLAAR
jgi:two-component system response regulator